MQGYDNRKHRHQGAWVDVLSGNDYDRDDSLAQKQYIRSSSKRRTVVSLDGTSVVPIQRRRPSSYHTQPSEPQAKPSLDIDILLAARQQHAEVRTFQALETEDKKTLRNDASIQIRIPKIRKGWLSRRLHASKQYFSYKRLGIAVGIMAVVVSSGYFLWFHPGAGEVKVTKLTATTKPTYAPLESSNGGSVKGVEYDASKEVYTFLDSFENANLTISQQPLPDKFRGNEEEVLALAKSIGATESFSTAYGTVYASPRSDTKTQRIVLVHRQLLVFIQSTRSLQNAEWVRYIQSLQ